MLPFNDKSSFSAHVIFPPRAEFFQFLPLVSSATKNGRKWSATAWWTSCQEPSPRLQNREIQRESGPEISTKFFGVKSKRIQNASKTRKWMENPEKKTNCFFRILSPENQPRKVNQKEENWINTQIRSQTGATQLASSSTSSPPLSGLGINLNWSSELPIEWFWREVKMNAFSLTQTTLISFMIYTGALKLGTQKKNRN